MKSLQITIHLLVSRICCFINTEKSFQIKDIVHDY